MLVSEARSVRPRKETQLPDYRIVALSNGTCLFETGEIQSEDQVIGELDRYPPCIFASRNIAAFVARCTMRHQHNPRWNFQAKTTERETFCPGKERPPVRVSVVINWFGFVKTKTQQSVRFVALDPTTFYGRSLDEIYPDMGNTHSQLELLLKWATDLRRFCSEYALVPKPTAGSLASQFLRDKRFYPRDRRKVPGFINETARGALPGNHYRLFAIEGRKREYQAIYIDQKRSHHYHAQHTRLPNANALHARGSYDSLDSGRYFSTSDSFSGLYYLHYTVPDPAPKFSIFSEQEAGQRYAGFVYSNELPFLRDNGYVIHGASASWGAFTYDTGIKAYSRWAQSELDRLGDPKWLKPILLSTYGVLAIRPRPISYVYGRTVKDAPLVSVPTGLNPLVGHLVGCEDGRKVEPGFANVLHRGMIEASCRVESVGFAQYLTDVLGFTVLSIYADAVIIEQPDRYSHILTHGKLPDPWRIVATLNHLQFLNRQAFTSGEMTKLPGILNRDVLRIARGTVGRAPKRKQTKTMAVSGEKFVDQTSTPKYLTSA